MINRIWLYPLCKNSLEGTRKNFSFGNSNILHLKNNIINFSSFWVPKKSSKTFNKTKIIANKTPFFLIIKVILKKLPCNYFSKNLFYRHPWILQIKNNLSQHQKLRTYSKISLQINKKLVSIKYHLLDWLKIIWLQKEISFYLHKNRPDSNKTISTILTSFLLIKLRNILPVNKN